jgi:hypothetical protein
VKKGSRQRSFKSFLYSDSSVFVAFYFFAKAAARIINPPILSTRPSFKLNLPKLFLVNGVYLSKVIFRPSAT